MKLILSTILTGWAAIANANAYTLVNAGYTIGRFIDIDHNYANVGWIFLQPYNKYKAHFFQDTQFYFLDNGDCCFSAGVGLRKYLSSCKGYLGANTYYDFRQVHHHKNGLNRIGVGLEYLSNAIVFRFNGYLPLNQYTRGNSFTVEYPGDYNATLFHNSIALWGSDGEVGRWFRSGYFEFFGAAGFYVYGAYQKGVLKHNRFAGGYGRFLVSCCRYLNFEMRASYDQVFQTRVEGVFSLQFPFEIFTCGCWIQNVKCQKGCENIAWKQPFRHNIVATTNCCCYDSWNWK